MDSLPSLRQASQAIIGVHHRCSAQRLIKPDRLRKRCPTRFTVNYGFIIPRILSVDDLRIDAPASKARRLLCGRFACRFCLVSQLDFIAIGLTGLEAALENGAISRCSVRSGLLRVSGVGASHAATYAKGLLASTGALSALSNGGSVVAASRCASSVDIMSIGL